MRSFISFPNGRLRSFLNFCLPTLFAVTLAAVLIKHFTLDDPHKCKAVLERGRWSHDFESHPPPLQWHPDGCMLWQHDSREAAHCLKELTIIGDSTARQLFWAIADKLKSRGKISTGSFELSPLIAIRANMTLAVGGQDVHFVWDPYLNNTSLATMPESWGQVIVISGGLFHAAYLQDEYLALFEQQVSRLATDFRVNDSNTSQISLPETSLQRRPIFLPISAPAQANLSPEWSPSSVPDRITVLNTKLGRLATNHYFDVMWAILAMTDGHDTAYESDGLHISDMIAQKQVDILLNRLCNARTDVGAGHYCCSKRDGITLVQAFLLAAAAATLAYCLHRRVRRSIWSAGTPLSKPAHALAVFAAVATYAYIADRTSIFERVNKLTDEKLFVGFCLASLFLGFLTTSRTLPEDTEVEKDNNSAKIELLPRQQTDEWKGWMQIVILLYHYFGMSRTMWVYRLARILVASYLFLTGYGHTRYLVNTSDFSSRRAVAVLVRLNLLSCMLTFIMGTKYDFYYFPAIASLWFVVTWLTISRNAGDGVDLRWVLARIGISLALMELFSRLEGFQDNAFSALRKLGMLSIDQREFAFRIRLDRYVPYFGMLTALLQHNYQRQPPPDIPWLKTRRAGKEATLLLLLLASIAYCVSAAGCHTKEAFNRFHAFTAPIPILTYVTLRNMTRSLRSYHSRLFAWFGRHSLETFILQYHIWLAADTKGLLRLGILARCLTDTKATISSWSFWVEAAVITIIFLWTCSCTSHATSMITNWIIYSGNVETANLSCCPQNQPRSFGRWKCYLSSNLGMRLKLLGILFLLWQFNLAW